MYFPIYSPDGTPVYPIGPSGYQSRWICGRDKVIEMEKTGFLEWKNIEGNWSVYHGSYLEGRFKHFQIYGMMLKVIKKQQEN